MKQYLDLIVKAVSDDSRVIRFLGSDDTKDRTDEIMTKEGWDLKNYKKNPVFLWAHQYKSPPIGRSLKTKITDNGLEFDIEFADAETYPFADTIYKLYKNDYLKAVSVGFIANEIQYTEEPKGPDTTSITKKELLELSACPVPCNPNALRLGMEKAIKDNVINEFEFAMFEDMAKDFIKTVDKKEPVSDPKPDPNAPHLKEDQILSQKNEDLIKKVIEMMTGVSDILTDLLKSINDNDKSVDDPKPEPDKKSNNIYDDIISISALKTKKKTEPFNAKDIDDINKIYNK